MSRQITSFTKNQLPGFIEADCRRQGGQPLDIAFGIRDGVARKYLERPGQQWIYIDHAYFKRGWEKSNFRAIRNGVHLTRLLDRPKDRIKQWGVQIEPWRKTGREIVVIPLTEKQIEFWGGDSGDWLMRTHSRLSEITDRPVVTKHGKFNSLREFCSDAWAVVTYSSVAGVEASFMGIPVFSTERCPSWPVNAGPLEAIETPKYSEQRMELAASLTYASWNTEEMKRVKWVDYQYEMLA